MHGTSKKSDVADTALPTVGNQELVRLSLGASQSIIVHSPLTAWFLLQPNVCPAHWQKIPSADMRGNGDDGLTWENPSPRQLYSAVRRAGLPTLGSP